MTSWTFVWEILIPLKPSATHCYQERAVALPVTLYRHSAQYLKFSIEANEILHGGLFYEFPQVYVNPVSHSSLGVTGNP